MKKLSIYLLALLTMGLAACTEDYTPSVGPQSNLPESQLQMSDVTVTSILKDFNIANYINEETGEETPIEIASVAVKEGMMPANTILAAKVEFSKDADFAESIVLDANSMAATDIISVQPSLLEDAYFNGITKNPAQTKIYVRTVLYTLTNGTSLAIVGKPNENYQALQNVNMTPLNKLTIAPAYYIIGGPNSDWGASATNRSIKFQHSDEDVYVDPVFTVVFDAADGDTWFAIGDDEACDAITNNNNYNLLYGIVGGDNEAKTGKLERRSIMGSENTFKVAAGAKKIRVTINMMEGTFNVEVINISETYYLIGGEKDWTEAEALTQPFTHSDKSVFDDPVFSYVIKGGAERWFTFGDADALAAITKDNDWKQLYGYVDQQADKGSFARRCDMEGKPDNTFHVDGNAKFYRFTVNMLTMEYEITALNFDPFVYFIGATEGWNNDEPNRQRLALTDENNGIYTGFLYCADPNGWGNQFKFQKIFKNWDSQVNASHVQLSGDLEDAGGNDHNFTVSKGEGVYFVKLDLTNMTIEGTKVEYMGVTGDFCGWNEGAEMTWNATEYCYELANAGATANGWKFRVNGKTDPNWKINLGGDMQNLTQDGGDFKVAASTIKLYPTRKTSDKIYCTVE